MWYFAHENEKKGSYSLQEMESLANEGTIDENTLVWQKGMNNWSPLGETELKSILPMGYYEKL